MNPSGSRKAGRALGDEVVNLLPTPMAHDFIPNTEAEMNRKSPRLNAIGGLLPTPAARDGLPAKTEETMQRQKDRGYGPNLNDVAANYLPTPKARDWTGHGPADMRRNTPDLSAISRILPTPLIEEDELTSPDAGGDPEKLLPTPSASDGIGGGPNNPQNRIDNGHHVQLVDLGMSSTVWGKYEAAIRCWERVTRPAPAPTEVNKNGNPRLAAGFSEWLMGWPQGHVTDPEIGISRNDQLRITGNGVVPQQAAHALRTLLRIAWDNSGVSPRIGITPV